ncbi:E3 ubiquitin ligase RNF121-like [Macrobrachium nipponense]|uniref:E3 ubiquitin ligase RNF121-like n=1 Tax=Macrobrachium nipponense TaxID=159736 RepID=UPI0030C8D227
MKKMMMIKINGDDDDDDDILQVFEVHGSNTLSFLTFQTDQESLLSEEEKWRLEHLRLHEKHRGHEEMHAEMVLILLAVTVASQIGLVAWKKHHYKSYQLVSMLGVWMIPFILCLHNHWWRFIFIWLLFSSITVIVVKKALERPLDPTTPRQVYKWFLLIYKICCGLGMVGYAIIMFTMMGFNLLFGVKPNVWMDSGLLFIFYGLYYGVLGRDMAEVCADKMASHIGYYTPHGMPTRTLEPGVCAVCGNPQLVPEGEEGIIENTYRLSCGHTFHEFCIRGWCIVGKKQTCPYCKEKKNHFKDYKFVSKDKALERKVKSHEIRTQLTLFHKRSI